MAKIKLQVNSSAVRDVYGRVDISFNGVKVGDNVQLSASTSTLVYNVASISTSAENTIKIDLLNDQAWDSNNDGDYSDAGDETMRVTVTSAEYSLDDSTYVAVLPQAQSTFTIPSGTNSGMVVELKKAIDEFKIYGKDQSIKFTTNDGLSAFNDPENLTQSYNPVAKVVGSTIQAIDGNTYDFDGNIV